MERWGKIETSHFLCYSHLVALLYRCSKTLSENKRQNYWKSVWSKDMKYQMNKCMGSSNIMKKQQQQTSFFCLNDL